jgi:RNA polymerase sigma-70 factor, ECF subfamily
MSRGVDATCTSSPSFRETIGRLAERDEAAARYVFDRYIRRLVAMARSRLDRRVRQKVDPEDVLQSVYLSFFVRNQRGQFNLLDWEGVWAVLAVITLRKCHRWNNRFRTRSRDIGVEVPAQGGSSAGREPASREPTPEEAAVLVELVEQLLRDLCPRDQEIVRCSLDGMTTSEIGARIGRCERTVLRVLERVKARLNAAPGD